MKGLCRWDHMWVELGLLRGCVGVLICSRILLFCSGCGVGRDVVEAEGRYCG